MDLKTFLENFDAIAEAPGGIPKLRSLILDLAVQGKLVPQKAEDESAELLRNQIVVEKQKLEKLKKIAKQRSLTPVQEDEQPYFLPSNWCWCRWNDVALHIGDIDHKMPTEVSEGIPYVSPRDFKEENTIDFEGAKKISYEDFERLKRKVQPAKGDIIFPRYGTIGENRLVEVDIDFLASYSCAVIKNFHGYIEPKYSYYYSISKLVKSEIERYTNKTTQANVGIQSIQNFIYPLPPLAEQKRIVEKVDELMALCDRYEAAKQTRDNLRQKLRESAIASLMDAETDDELNTAWAFVRDNWHNLSQQPEDVDDLRRSVLQLAVRGKLVSQMLEDGTASELLEKIKYEKRRLGIKDSSNKKLLDEAPYDLPASWVWTYLDRIMSFMDAGWSPACKAHPTSNLQTWGVLRTTAIQALNYRWQEHKELPSNLIPRPEYEVKPGDILITRAGPKNRVGICCLVEVTRPKLMISDKIIRFHLVENFLFPNFITLSLNSGFSQDYIEAQKSGMAASQMNISQSKLKDTPIPLPPLAEQKRIVAKVNELMKLCDQLEASLRQSQQRAESLAASAISHLTI